MYTRAYMWRSEVDTGTFLSCALPYFLSQRLSLNLESTNLTSLADQHPRDLSVPASLILGLQSGTTVCAGI